MMIRFVFLEERVAEDVFGGFFSGFVKPIHIELSDEAINIAMSEILGEDGLLELVDVFDAEFFSVWHPADDFVMLVSLDEWGGVH